MSRIINISEAASLALHSLTLIANSKQMINTQQIASMTGFSKNHLSKVLQTLVRNGYVQSNRGPKGGFVMKIQPQYIALLDIYELFEGKLEREKCVLHQGKCPFENCIFGGLTGKFTDEFYEYMKKQTLKNLTL